MPDPVSALAAGSVGSGIASLLGMNSAKESVAEGVAAANAASREMLERGLSTQRDYFQKGYDVLSPVAEAGKGVYNKLVEQLPDLTAPIVMDQTALEATPGYKFNVAQGIRAIDLSSIGRGLSGAQAKAAAAFGVNTANTLYKDQFDMANINKTNAFNRLMETAKVGTGAAGAIAGNATSAGNAALSGATGTGNTIAGNTMSGAKTEAQLEVGMGNTVGNTISNVAGMHAGKNMINKLLA